jgi:hypothetical protein
LPLATGSSQAAINNFGKMRPKSAALLIETTCGYQDW